MKKHYRTFILALAVCAMLLGCDAKKEDNTPPADPAADKITAEIAYEGVNNYCHSEYDWSAAEENPDIMSVTLGEETDAEYQVIFHSYTGSVVNFYVDKESGVTRMVEYVPALDKEEDAGTINLYDYLEQNG